MDWYIELTKSKLGPRVEKGGSAKYADPCSGLSPQAFHPFMPFITEEIWQKLPQNEDSIMVSAFRGTGKPN
ncbi:MAG: hypothetical protein Ct9H300mP23_05300 [Nitrospinota bacterium]|nr:MAG: hypothetical protein Ct9H300mP23_05300 [Nitrospinota bacterium]